jgi:alkaline phosphatase D
VILMGVTGAFWSPGAGAESRITAGPMVGFGTHHEVAIWAQTHEPSSLRIKYWPISKPAKALSTDTVRTAQGSQNTILIHLTDLTPGTRYAYEIWLDNASQAVKFEYPIGFQTQPMWRRFKDRGPPEFVVALGSCAYTNDKDYEPANPYGGGYEIYESIRKQSPDLMLWLGDNVYFRASDWGSPSGLLRRYARSRALPQLQGLLASTHNYAIWDDHDYGPNDSNRSYVHKSHALDAFKQYWANPSYGLPNTPGVFTQFTWGDVDFFLLDNRFYRSPSNAPREPSKTQFGAEQLQWLIDGLTASRAPFKIVAAGGQFLSPFDRWEGSAQFPHEQRALIDQIIKRRISGVVFLSGDRHHTELVRIKPDGFYPLFDFTSSPLTSRGASADGEWKSPVRVPGTLVTKQRNFGLLRFDGPANDRLLTLETRDTRGRLLWTQTMSAKELRPHSRKTTTP